VGGHVRAACLAVLGRPDIEWGPLFGPSVRPDYRFEFADVCEQLTT